MMNVIDRYNAIIDAIESLISNNPELENKEIIQEAFYRAKYIGEENSKIHRGIFLFLTEMTAENYISERRMMQAYKHLISSEQWDCQGAYRITGLAQKSFIRKFEATFNMQPREAYKAKNLAFFKTPLYWDNLVSKGKDIFMQNNFSVSGETMFGIPMSMYVLAQSAQNLQSYFGLNDREANFAFKLSEEKGSPIEDTFEYVYAYVWKYIDGEKENGNHLIPHAIIDYDKRDRYLERDLGNRYVQYMYFTLGYGFSMISEIISALSLEFAEGKPITYELIKTLYNEICKLRKEEEEYYEEYNSSRLDEDSLNYLYEAAYSAYLDRISYRQNSALDSNYDYDMDDPDIIDELFLDDPIEELAEANENALWEKECFDLNNLEEYEKCCEEAAEEHDLVLKSKKILPGYIDDLSYCYQDLFTGEIVEFPEFFEQ